MVKKKDTKESGATIAETIKAIKGRFGDDSIMKLDQKPLTGIDCIPTGSFGLDIALGIGGFPRGRIVEIFGPESCGKTTLALHTIAEAQKQGGTCAYIDAEHAMDPEYAKRLGVNTGDLFISQPSNGEEGLEMLEMLVRSAKFAVIVVDSVATLTPKEEIEGEMGAATMGRQARLMSQAMRKLVAIIGVSNSVVLFINQIRSTINSFGGPAEYTSGGKAMKFYPSVRLDIRRIAQIKKGEEVMGGRVKVKVVKNKCAPPFRQAEFDLMYNEGISRESEILATGEKTGFVIKTGNTYKYGDQKLGVGYDASRQYLKANKELANEIAEKIKNKLMEIVAPASGELENNNEE